MTTARSPDISHWVGQKDEIKLSAANAMKTTTAKFDVPAKAALIEETAILEATAFLGGRSVDVRPRSAIL